LAGKYKQGPLSLGSPHYSELLGWILSDGHFETGRLGVNISHSETANLLKIKKIKLTFKKLGIKSIERSYKQKYPIIWDYDGNKTNIMHNFAIYGDWIRRIRRDIPDKKPTWELLQLKPSELIYLFKGLMSGALSFILMSLPLL